MTEVHVHGGSVIGRDHLLMGKNRQDTYALSEIAIGEQTVHLGILADGCGSTPTSEVGANLLVRYMSLQLGRNLAAGKTAEVAIAELFGQTKRYIRRLVKNIAGNSVEERGKILHEYFLATIIGFVTEGEDVLVFVSGDGTIFFGDYHLAIDEDNKPSYLAYSLVDDQLVSSFKVYRLALESYHKVAIATDGFETELISSFWGKTHPNGVQRQLNALSKKKHFSDDATLITIELAEEVEPE